jgi:hypothetical protein
MCDHEVESVTDSPTAYTMIQMMKRSEWIAMSSATTPMGEIDSVAVSDGVAVWVRGYPYSLSLLVRDPLILKVVFGDERVPCNDRVDLANEIAYLLGCKPPETLRRAMQLLLPDVPMSALFDDRCPHCCVSLLHRLYEALIDRRGSVDTKRVRFREMRVVPPR